MPCLLHWLFINKVSMLQLSTFLRMLILRSEVKLWLALTFLSMLILRSEVKLWRCKNSQVSSFYGTVRIVTAYSLTINVAVCIWSIIIICMVTFREVLVSTFVNVHAFTIFFMVPLYYSTWQDIVWSRCVNSHWPWLYNISIIMVSFCELSLIVTVMMCHYLLWW